MGGFVREGSSDSYVLLGGGGHKLISDFMTGNNGHDYVEIAGLKWATMNIGASKVTDPGLYFQWGDINGYTGAQVKSGMKNFKWEDYKYGNGTSSPSGSGMTRYNYRDSLKQLDIVDDAASRNWGGTWRMPTTEEYVALSNAVNTAWTADYQGSGVAGRVCTDKTDSSKVLFFPACGFCSNGSVSNVGSYGYYWSSSLFYNEQSYHLYFTSRGVTWDDFITRNYGMPVRGVIG